jgi:soluble lytic murein transglycosylase
VASGNEADLPLAFAIVRQESQFNKSAVSAVGARGLMQLMPATAQEVCQALSLPYSAARLLSDADYNLTLGRAYLGRLLGRFNRSHLLAIAAYNAGPARVTRWLSVYGDPRRKNVDAVDWVETIPVEETRNYVQRVLENLQVYRVRLGAARARIGVLKDLEG